VRLHTVVIAEELRGQAVFLNVSPLQVARALTVWAFIKV
jgi:hypothetical protein